MRSSLRRVFRWIQEVHHPSSGTLAGLIDGELTRTQSATVNAHLERCAHCRGRLERLQEGLHLFNKCMQDHIPQFPTENGLTDLLSRIRERELSTADKPVLLHPQPARVLYDRLLAELSIYIGRATAIRLLDRCNHDLLQRDRFSQIVEPVMAAFLGQQAGAAVLANVLRIWDRTRQVPS